MAKTNTAPTYGVSPSTSDGYISPVTISDISGSLATRGVEASPATSSMGSETEFPFSGRSALGITARAAGRINAASASKEELEALLSERQRLLDIKLAGNLTKSDANRLAYIRWSIDRIQDARYGEPLDRLAQQAEALERLSQEIKFFQSDLLKHKRNTPRR